MAADKEAKDNAATAHAPAGGGGWMPVIVVVVLVPAISFALAEFVLFPRLEKRLAAAGLGNPAAAVQTAGESHAETAAPSGKHAAGATEADPTYSYEFKDVVSNLAGSMKSRYIKVSFTGYSSDPDIQKVVEENKAKLLDSTLSVLGSLTLADLEDATIKNRVRSQLVQAFEAILHKREIEEIYFSEFVVQ